LGKPFEFTLSRKNFPRGLTAAEQRAFERGFVERVEHFNRGHVATVAPTKLTRVEQGAWIKGYQFAGSQVPQHG
jgi:hypothetical protein